MKAHVMPLLNVGENLPDLTLLNDKNEPVRLQDLKGGWGVLYFYPKAMTPGCTVQACALRDAEAEIAKMGLQIYGVSPDTPALLAKFKSKEMFTFVLLSDEDHMLAQACGAWVEKSMYGKKYMGMARITYIFDPAGRVARVMEKVDPQTHWDEVRLWLKQHGI